MSTRQKESATRTGLETTGQPPGAVLDVSRMSFGPLRLQKTSSSESATTEAATRATLVGSSSAAMTLRTAPVSPRTTGLNTTMRRPTGKSVTPDAAERGSDHRAARADRLVRPVDVDDGDADQARHPAAHAVERRDEGLLGTRVLDRRELQLRRGQRTQALVDRILQLVREHGRVRSGALRDRLLIPFDPAAPLTVDEEHTDHDQCEREERHQVRVP